jgi:metallo-beta-lactamase class B
MFPLRNTLAGILLLLIGMVPNAAMAQQLIPLPANNPEWSKPHDPFRIAGNLYYVGTYDLGCYLITTPEGHILINTGLAESTPVIREHIEKLGFKFSDIKILLCTQAHYDHVGAMAEIKQLTGAKMMADAGDVAVLEDGGNSDYVMGGKGAYFKSVKVDRQLRDKDVISLGGTTLTMLHHPGHTKGSCSYLLTVKDTKRYYRVLIANFPTILPDVNLHGMPNYPNVGKDFALTFASLKKQQFDICLASHASQFGLHDKYKPGKYDPMAFAGRKKFDEEIKDLYAQYLEKLSGK